MNYDTGLIEAVSDPRKDGQPAGQWFNPIESLFIVKKEKKINHILCLWYVPQLSVTIRVMMMKLYLYLLGQIIFKYYKIFILHNKRLLIYAVKIL